MGFEAVFDHARFIDHPEKGAPVLTSRDSNTSGLA